MAEYIDREAFLEHMKSTSRYFDVKFDIEDFPAADVAPVRHGRWLWNKTGELGWEQYYICSNCGDNEYWECKF